MDQAGLMSRRHQTLLIRTLLKVFDLQSTYIRMHPKAAYILRYTKAAGVLSGNEAKFGSATKLISEGLGIRRTLTTWLLTLQGLFHS